MRDHFDRALQAAVLGRLVGRLGPGGGLVNGRGERRPGARPDLEPWLEDLPIYRRI
jgi:hypothetical protein